MDLPPWQSTSEVPLVSDTKAHNKSPTKDPSDQAFIPHSLYSVHEFKVAADADGGPWLESDERKREWVSFAEAMSRVAWRRGMDQMLQQSSLANA